MWLLTLSIVIFFVVIAFLMYANMPATPASQGPRCGCGGGGGGCPKCPCNRCGHPKRQCGCPKQGGESCSFC